MCSTATCRALREGSQRCSCTASAHVTLSLLLASCLGLGSLGKMVSFDSGFRQPHMLCSRVGWHQVQLQGQGDHGARYGNNFSSLRKQGCCFHEKVDVITPQHTPALLTQFPYTQRLPYFHALRGFSWCTCGFVSFVGKESGRKDCTPCYPGSVQVSCIFLLVLVGTESRLGKNQLKNRR